MISGRCPSNCHLYAREMENPSGLLHSVGFLNSPTSARVCVSVCVCLCTHAGVCTCAVYHHRLAKSGVTDVGYPLLKLLVNDPRHYRLSPLFFVDLQNLTVRPLLNAPHT